MTEEELAVVRRAFAQQMLALARTSGNAALEAAFRAVPRERFLGVDPWVIVLGRGEGVELPANDPVYAYQDVLFRLSQMRCVNNGSPSLHARLIDALSPLPGQAVAHLGAGTGYYAAVLAEMVGPHGRVSAVEIDPAMGRRAREALAGWPNVEVTVADGRAGLNGPFDRIYVNFAVTAPSGPWIEHLAASGRLVFALGVPGTAVWPGAPQVSQQGAAFLVERRGDDLAASHICPAYFVHGEGDATPRDDAMLKRLALAFRSGKATLVRSLIWGREADQDRCWFATPDWSLSYDPV